MNISPFILLFLTWRKVKEVMLFRVFFVYQYVLWTRNKWSTIPYLIITLYSVFKQWLADTTYFERFAHVEGEHYQLCKLPEHNNICSLFVFKNKTSRKQLSINTSQTLKILTAAQYSNICLHLDFPSITMASLQCMIFCHGHRSDWKDYW